MKMSVFYPHLQAAARQRQLPLETILEEAAALGFQGVECSAAELLADPQGFVRQLGGLTLCSAYYRFDFHLEINEELMDKVLSALHDAGCPRLLAIPGDLVEGQIPEQMFEGLTRLCEKAAALGITVTLEDFDSILSPCATAKGLRRLFDRVEKLGFTLDTGNFRYAQEDVLEAAVLLKDRLAHMHLKDRSLVCLNPQDEPCISIGGEALYPCSVGSGDIPMEALLAIAKDAGFDGWCSAEHFGAADQWGCITGSARWLKEHLPGA